MSWMIPKVNEIEPGKNWHFLTHFLIRDLQRMQLGSFVLTFERVLEFSNCDNKKKNALSLHHLQLFKLGCNEMFFCTSVTALLRA